MKRAFTEQSRQSLALKPSSSETYRVETDSGKLTSISSFLHFLINPMKGLYERYFKVCLCGELIKLSFVQLTFQFPDLELLIGELSILKVGFVMCKKLILRDQTFFIGHEEALLEHQQDLLWCSKLSESLYYLRGVEGSYVTFYHLKVLYDWDTQCAKAKIREHKHTIWNATKNMTTTLAATLILGIFEMKCGNLIIRIDDLNVHVLAWALILLNSIDGLYWIY